MTTTTAPHITTSGKYAFARGTSRYFPEKPLVELIQHFERNDSWGKCGEWLAESLLDLTPGGQLAIDFGQSWSLSVEETAEIRAFAAGVLT